VLAINAAADTTIRLRARLGKAKHRAETRSAPRRKRRQNITGAITAPIGYDRDDVLRDV
jgi:hypothetical protein